MKIDKCRKTETNEKMSIFDKKFKNEKSNKRQHKNITKIFSKNY